MADTNLLVLAREYKKLREEVKKVLSMPKGDKVDQGEKGEKGDTGDTGPQGFPGRDGKDGINGYDGKEGRNGVDGKDGKDGLDGVGVANAYIDFDNSLVIVLTDGREVNAGFLSQETKDNVVATFKQGAATINELLPPQAGNANKFLKTDGTDVSWDTLDGSDIDLSSPPVIGNVTPNAGTFTTLTATGQTSLGGAADSESLRVLVPGTAGGAYETVQAGSNFLEHRFAGTQANISLRTITKGTGSIGFFTNNSASNLQFNVAPTASAVNFVQVTGASTTNRPIISAQGSDTNIGLVMGPKGTGTFAVLTDGAAFTGFVVNPRATNGDTWIETQRNVGFVDLVAASGVTNGDIRLTPKGTGLVRFGTRTASADAAITGYIEIRDAGGTIRRLAVIG
jgi:hypothetical protein